MTRLEIVDSGVIGIGTALSLARLWLRLRFRLRDERERRHYLRTAATLPAGSRIQEQRGDGTQLIVTVGGGSETSPDDRRP